MHTRETIESHAYQGKPFSALSREGRERSGGASQEALCYRNPPDSIPCFFNSFPSCRRSVPESRAAAVIFPAARFIRLSRYERSNAHIALCLAET